MEVRLGKLIVSSGGRITPQIRTLRAAAQETLTLLHDTVKRRDLVRQRIAQLEAAEASRLAALSPAPPATEISPQAAPPRIAAPSPPAPLVEERDDPAARTVEAARPAQPAPVAVPEHAAAPPEAPATPPPTAAQDVVPPPAEKEITPAAPRVEAAAPAEVRAPAGHQEPAVAAAPPAPPATALPETTQQPRPAEAVWEVPAAGTVRPETTIRRQELERLPQGTPLLRVLRERLLRPKHLATALLSVLLVLLALLMTPLPELFGWQLYAVQSGSMEPAIPVGSIVAVRPVPAGSLRVGDVITFSDKNRPEVRVTHRIVALDSREGRQVAVTKGDANETSDSWNVPVDTAIGRVAFHVPHAGYVVYWLASPAVRLLALVAVCLMLLAPLLSRPRKEAPPGEGRSVETLESEIDALLAEHPMDGPAAGRPAAAVTQPPAPETHPPSRR